MKNIKVKEISNKTIKQLDKTSAWTEHIKDSTSLIKDNLDNKENTSISDYGEGKIKYYSEKSKDLTVNSSKKAFMKSKDNLVKTYQKKKLTKNNNRIKNNVPKIKKTVKKAKDTKKAINNSKVMIQRARNFTEKSLKKTVQGIKIIGKVVISGIKALIQGLSSLIGLLASGGTIAVIVVVIICLIGLLCSSIFGIFLSSEKTSPNAITMNNVVAECNQEFSDKLQNIQDTNPHDDYILEGGMSSWKDVLLIYTVKQSNGINQQDVMTIDDNKKVLIKQIFWDMNEISSEVKTEMVTEQGTNINELPTQVQKRVLHIKISSKTIEAMKVKYSFNMKQNQQLAELSDSKYSLLWNGVIYGSNDTGEYVSWRQKDPSWANVRIGNTTSTIGDIGCLVTSIAILIEKSGVNTQIQPFNPGTFVDALNKNGGFDGNGNLQYSPISKVVPEFKFGGQINLRGKSRTEKLALITQYLNNGYYITAEVKGATPGNQHWVAITGVNGNNINMIDPGSNQTDLWSAYEFVKTSQFNYFQKKI